MDTSWKAQGGCVALDPELFFPIGAKGAAQVQIREAKAVCLSCPVRIRCRDYALRRPEVYGIWGGLTEDERAKLHSRARRTQRSVWDVLHEGAA